MGGGTFNPVRNHLSLAAPAFGKTARYLFEESIGVLDYSKIVPLLVLTKMANPYSPLLSNKDVSDAVDKYLEDESVKVIIFNVALCDFETTYKGVESGFHAERLKTAKGSVRLTLTPSEKIITRIRKVRPDIFLVGFKTTTNATTDEQFELASKMIEPDFCNIVFANDTVTRQNMIVTSKKWSHARSNNREDMLDELLRLIKNHTITSWN